MRPGRGRLDIGRRFQSVLVEDHHLVIRSGEKQRREKSGGPATHDDNPHVVTSSARPG
jgi:hypothetical protein